ncbi:MAG: hypothetical protein HY537_18330 [Deltaproteobacteria bacterium]|nr:hypothetical protein [Deltaproteobacteria bacterium]
MNGGIVRSVALFMVLLCLALWARQAEARRRAGFYSQSPRTHSQTSAHKRSVAESATPLSDEKAELIHCDYPDCAGGMAQGMCRIGLDNDGVKRSYLLHILDDGTLAVSTEGRWTPAEPHISGQLFERYKDRSFDDIDAERVSQFQNYYQQNIVPRQNTGTGLTSPFQTNLPQLPQPAKPQHGVQPSLTQPKSPLADANSTELSALITDFPKIREMSLDQLLGFAKKATSGDLDSQMKKSTSRDVYEALKLAGYAQSEKFDEVLQNAAAERLKRWRAADVKAKPSHLAPLETAVAYFRLVARPTDENIKILKDLQKEKSLTIEDIEEAIKALEARRK